MNHILKETHMGYLIESKLYDQGISISRFADMINTSRQNVYHIFKRKIVKPELLKLISNALDYDFSQHIPRNFNPSDKESRIKLSINIDTCDPYLQGLFEKLCHSIEELNHIQGIKTEVE